MPIIIAIMGRATLSIPIASPVIILVAAPVLDAFAVFVTGDPAVYHSVIRPIEIPTIHPTAIAQKTPISTPLAWVMKYARTRKIPAAINVAYLSAAAGLSFSSISIEPIPRRDAISPTIITAIGNAMYVVNIPVLSMYEDVVARAIVAITEPTYDSKRSAPIPATSPTLSAITAGFLGSSSGMPASTLPTRSAPTSAVFV